MIPIYSTVLLFHSHVQQLESVHCLACAMYKDKRCRADTDLSELLSSPEDTVEIIANVCTQYNAFGSFFCATKIKVRKAPRVSN